MTARRLFYSALIYGLMVPVFVCLALAALWDAAGRPALDECRKMIREERDAARGRR